MQKVVMIKICGCKSVIFLPIFLEFFTYLNWCNKILQPQLFVFILVRTCAILGTFPNTFLIAELIEI